jgi:ATP-dependent Clp protease ATP-binding subunit ClpC
VLLAAKLGINVELIRQDTERIVKTIPWQISPDELELSFALRANRAVDFAVEEAQCVSEEGPRVDIQDLLIGLLREKEGLAAQLLMNQGLTLDYLRKRG